MVAPLSWPASSVPEGRPDWGDGRGSPYYGRAPAAIAPASEDNGLVPHSDVNRASYTVPAGRVAYLEAVYLGLHRATAPTAAGAARARLVYTPSGSSERILAEAYHQSATVGAGHELLLTGGLWLATGDEIILRTSDASTAGTYDFLLGAKLTEFNR